MTHLDFATVAPLAALLLTALIVAVADLWVTDPQRKTTYFLTQASLAVVAALYLAAFNDGVPHYGMGGLVVSDAMGNLLGFLATASVMVTLVYVRPSLAARDMLKGEFFTLSMFALLGIGVMLSAQNFLVIYLGLELMSLSLYALTALRRDHAVATEAAMKYFVLGALASGFLLYGMSMMYGATGSLDLQAVFRAIATGQLNMSVLVFGTVFLVAGLAFKLGAVPFHMWVPDVYQGAPTSVTLLIAGAPKLAAFAITVRLLVEGMLPLAHDWQQMLIVLALGSLSIGNLVAIAQTNLKRMLAYSTIAHMGFVLLGLAAGVVGGNALSAANAYSSAMFYIVTYVLTTLGTFGVIALLSRPGFESEQIDDLAGLAKRSPWLAGVMTVLMFSLAGIPPTVGFFAKLSVLQAVVSTNQPGYFWLAIFAVVFSLIGAYYYLRAVKVMWFDEPQQTAPVSVPADAALVMGLNGLAVLILGMWPDHVLSLVAYATQVALGH